MQFDGASKGTLEPLAGDPGARALLSSGGLRIFLKAGQSVLLDGKKPVRDTDDEPTPPRSSQVPTTKRPPQAEGGLEPQPSA
jgi:hypothetical protein